MKPPRPDQVLAARTAAGMTQGEAAAVVYVHRRTWQSWEAIATGRRIMPAASYELFLIKTARTA